jgi:hypothetical protein
MKEKSLALGILLFVGGASQIRGQDIPQAAEVANEGKVTFWQSGYRTGGSGGACVARFDFFGGALIAEVDNLTLGVRVFGSDGQDLGVHGLALGAPLGGGGAGQHVEAGFTLNDWPHKKEGVPSPLCSRAVRLIVESAVGRQGDKTVDLVRYGQLKFTEFQRLSVAVATDQLNGTRAPDTTRRREEYRAPAPGERRPQESQQHYLNGVILYQKGDYLRTKKEWDLAVQLDPSNDDARAGLARLEKLLGAGGPQ